MNNRTRSCCTLLLLSIPIAGFAQDPDPSPARFQSLLLASGVDLSDDDLDFYELLYTRDVPSWEWDLGERTLLSTRFWVSLGAFEQGDDRAAYATLGPVFYIHRNGDAYVDFSVRLTLLSDEIIGRIDYGGPVQFTTHIGAGYWFDSGWEIGVRLQHTSNGRLFEPNPDINFAVLQIGYGF